MVAGASVNRVDDERRQHCTVVNGVTSPTDSPSARTWHGSSPVYSAYRTGWIPSNRTPTSPVSPKQPFCRPGDDACLSTVPANSGQPPTSSVFAVDSAERRDARVARSLFANSNGHASPNMTSTISEGLLNSAHSPMDGMVNGCSHESNVTSLSSSGCSEGLNGQSGRDSDPRLLSIQQASEGVSAEKPSHSSNSTSVSPAVVSMESQTQDQVDISDKCGSSLVASCENGRSVDNSSCSRVMAVASPGVDAEPQPYRSVPPLVSLGDHQAGEFNGFTTGADDHTSCSEATTVDNVDQKPNGQSVTTPSEHDKVERSAVNTEVAQSVPQPRHSANGSGITHPSNGSAVSSSLHACNIHRDSDLLLSARRTSIDYFQKVSDSISRSLLLST